MAGEGSITVRFIRSLLLLVCCCFAAQAAAFPTTRHYSVATEPEHLALDFHDFWDSEASSDFITYQRPVEWDEKFWRGDRVFDLTVGSISSRQFLSYKRLKLVHDLTESVQFKLLWLEERDAEQDVNHIPIELRFRLSSKFALSAFGTPSMYKAENDVGLSAEFTPNDKLEYRGSVVWGDFQRNQRNVEADLWSTAPVGFTVSAMYLGEVDFARVEAHYEPRSRRSLNGVAVADLAHESVFFTGIKRLSMGRSLSARLLYERSFYSDFSEVSVKKRSLNQFEYSFPLGPHIIRPGLNVFYRDHRTNSESVIFRELLPTLWFQLPSKSRRFGVSTVSLGYDATVYQKEQLGQYSNDGEHRLNIKWDMLFNKAGQLALLFTIDLDRFGSGETWEGGAGQFRLDF